MKDTATKQQNTTATQSQTDQQIAEAEEEVRTCTKKLMSEIKSLRQEQNFDDGEAIVVYVTDAPLVHRALEVYRDEIEKATCAIEFVQINVDAGNPMPEHLSHKEINIGDQTIDVAIDEADEDGN